MPINLRLPAAYGVPLYLFVCVPSAERNVHLSVCEGVFVLRVLDGCIG